ncbi:MAG: ABC transporter substrate-binding protein [Leucobacter sp.]
MLHSRPRARALLAAGIASLLLLSGCASDAAPSADEHAAQALLPAAEGTTDYPLTLETPYGDTVLKERPERVAIITASTVDTDALVALGGLPVFAPSTVERNTWLDDGVVDQVEVLWESEAGAEASAEAVAAVEPDLIVNLYAYETFDQAQFEKFSSVAPVLYAGIDELTWQELTQMLGETLDLGQAASDAIDAAETAVADIRTAHPEFEGKTATQVMVYPEEYGASYNTAPGYQAAPVFEDLGFVIPEAADKFIDDDVISNELIGLVDSDFVLVSLGSSEAADTDYFTESPLLKALPAFVDGRLVIDPADPETGINDLSWGINVPSAISIPWVSERLAELGAKALS